AMDESEDEEEESGEAAASFEELDAALPNASADFIVGQLKQKASVAEATAAYIEQLEAQVGTKVSRPAGVPPVRPKSKKGHAAAAEASDVGSQIEALTREEMEKKGCAPHEARCRVLAANPELREALVAAANAKRQK